MKRTGRHDRRAAIDTFFQKYSEEMLENWLRQAYVSPGSDPFYKEVVKNGRHTLRLFRTFLLRPHTFRSRAFIKKIASERMKANTELETFVSNIHAGRDVVITTICSSSMSEKEKIEWIIQANRFFDLYLRRAVTAYSELKESVIEDKNRFIQEMHHDRLSILGKVAASFAHDFRNPLTAVKGFVTLLQKQLRIRGMEQHYSHYFSTIGRELQQLEDKVNHFLYLSKMRAAEDEKQLLDATELLRQTVELLHPRFLQENIDVRLEAREQICVYGVKEQLKQVFMNIMNNAVDELIKEKEERRLSIRLYRDKSNAVLEFTNNGSPIPPHMTERIFEPFVSMKELGTGLGLSVCKQIVEKHDGSIAVHSTEERTIFTVKLPIFESC